jgi:Transposase DDE domain
VIYCKAWRVRNTGGRYAKDQFTLGFDAGRLTCPAGVSMPFEPGKIAHFPGGTCATCPLRQRCTTSSRGRSVSIHPDEALPAELRERQQDPQGRAKAARTHRGRARPGPRRPRARPPRPLPGHRKNLFDLRRVAAVHHLHVIARRPATGTYQKAA